MSRQTPRASPSRRREGERIWRTFSDITLRSGLVLRRASAKATWITRAFGARDRLALAVGSWRRPNLFDARDRDHAEVDRTQLRVRDPPERSPADTHLTCAIRRSKLPLAASMYSTFAVLAGPYATMVLGDPRADLVKVETPERGTTPPLGPPFAVREARDRLLSSSTATSVLSASTSKPRGTGSGQARGVATSCENWMRGPGEAGLATGP